MNSISLRTFQNTPALTFSVIAFLAMVGLAVFFPETGIVLQGNPAHILLSIFAATTILGTVDLYAPSRFGWKFPVIACTLAALLALNLGSTLHIPNAFSRGMAMYSCSLGGFMAGLLLFNTRLRLNLLLFGLFAMLLAYVLICLANAWATGSSAYPFVSVHKHAQASFMFILCLAPIAFLFARKRFLFWLSALLPLLCFLVFYLMNSRIGMLAPLAMVPVLCIIARLNWKRLILILALVLAATLAAFVSSPYFQRLQDLSAKREAIFYRTENIFFAMHVLGSDPAVLFRGAGLRSPKKQYLQDYEIVFPGLDQERYKEVLSRIISFDNTFLSLSVDVGLPFALLYFGALGVVMFRAILACRRPNAPPELKAVTFTACLMLMHMAIYDGLYYATVGFLFHLVLGLVCALTFYAPDHTAEASAEPAYFRARFSADARRRG